LGPRGCKNEGNKLGRWKTNNFFVAGRRRPDDEGGILPSGAEQDGVGGAPAVHQPHAHRVRGLRSGDPSYKTFTAVSYEFL
jgi:hypothetical protein